MTFWVKEFSFAIMEKSLETFPFWALTFFCSRKLNFGIWKGDFSKSGPSKGVNVVAIFRYVVKIEVFSEGKTRKNFSSASGFVSKD